MDDLRAADAAKPSHKGTRNDHRVMCGKLIGRGASGQLAPEGAKLVYHPVDDPVATPEIEILLDRRSWRKTKWNCPPLASDGEHVLDRVEHLPEVCLAGASSLGQRRKTRFDQIPFLICQIAFKPSPRACILGFGGLVPACPVSFCRVQR